MPLSRVLAALPLALPAGQEAPPAAPPAAPRAEGYESAVPSDTLLFIGIDSVDELMAEWRASALGRCVADEAAQPLRDAFAGFLEALSGSSKEELGVDLVEAARMIDGRVGFASGGVLFGEWKGHTVVGLESTQRIGELQALAMALVQKFVEDGEAVLKNETIGAREVVQVTPLDAADKALFQVAVNGTTLAVDLATGDDVSGERFARTLQALDGESGETLAQRPDFLQSLAARPGGIKLFLDSGAAIRATSPPGADGAESAGASGRRVLGLDRLGALAARFAMGAEETRLDAHQAWEPIGLANVLIAFMSGGDHHLLKLLPVDSAMTLSLQLDLPRGIDAANALAKEAGGPPLFGEPTAEGGAPGAGADAFEPRRDVLDHLDGRLALSMVPVPPEESLLGMGLQGGPSLNGAIVLGVKNGAALAASIDKLLRTQGLHAARRKSEFEGYVVYTLPIAPVNVSYAIVDDFLVVSPSATLLQDVLRRKSNVELPNLRGSPGFAANFAALSAAPSLLLWSSNEGNELLESMSRSLREPAIDPGYAVGEEEPDEGEGFGEDEGGGFGDESGGEDEPDVADDVPPHVKAVERAGDALLAAIEKLDPLLMKKHMPAGSIGGISCDAGGLRLEIVAR